MLNIRTATNADIPLLRDLCLQVWPQTYAPILAPAQIEYMLEMMYSPQSLTQQLQDGATFLLCYDATTPVGFASYKALGQGAYKLDKLYVLMNHQSKGVGRFFIEHIVQTITPLGARSLELQVNKHNNAKQFYERNHFQVAYEKVLEIGNGYVMDDYIMLRPLTPAFEQALQDLLTAIETDTYQFASTLAFITQWFDFTPSAFRNGTVSNNAEQNQGSCRVLAMALLLGLSTAQTLKCFGEHYRDVLATPGVDNHHNLRRLQAEGLVDIQFDRQALRRK
jgi:diamine N-acetyltransferase